MNSVKDNWTEILNLIKNDHNLTQYYYDTWLRPLSICREEKDKITILVPESISKAVGYIKDKFLLSFKVTIAELTGKEYDISFMCEGESPDVPEPASADTSYNSGLNPKFTFSSFVTGKTNEFAYAAALAVAEEPGKNFNPLFLYGGSGLGKTHLMHSIAHFIKESRPSLNILYVTSENFTNEVIESIRSGSPLAMSKFRDKYRNIDVLLVDDIQFIIGKEATQEEFFHTFNELQMAGKQIVISSDRPPKDMHVLEERFRSRFMSGLMVDIQPPDYETRIAILRKKMESDGIIMSDEVTSFIASNIRSNIRELEGSLTTLSKLAELKHSEITLDFAKEALIDYITPEEKRVLSPEIAMKIIADYFGVTEEDLKSDRRSADISYPRQLLMYLLREKLQMTLPAIGNFLGKDHSTVSYGINKIRNDIKNSDAEKEKVDAIIKLLK